MGILNSMIRSSIYVGFVLAIAYIGIQSFTVITMGIEDGWNTIPLFGYVLLSIGGVIFSATTLFTLYAISQWARRDS